MQEPVEPSARSDAARLLGHSFDATLTWTIQGAIRYWNKGAERLYGSTAAEAIGKVSHVLLWTEFPQSVNTCLHALRERGQWEGELRHVSRDGSHRRQPDGRVRSVYGRRRELVRNGP